MAFRLAIGAAKLKSTAFEVEIRDGETVFHGRGYGHGVGMCQWGARGYARRGWDYVDILGHYYPGAALIQLAALVQ
jgi:stage II sporulation protein D